MINAYYADGIYRKNTNKRWKTRVFMCTKYMISIRTKVKMLIISDDSFSKKE